MEIVGIEYPVIYGDQPKHNGSSFNSTLCSSHEELFFNRTEFLISLVTFYTLVFCGCFFGNLLVIIAIVTSRRLRSTTNIFLANLAIADFSVGVFCVYQNLSIYLAKSWLIGDFVCKMYHFIHNLSYTASIFLLVVLSVERYLAILRPMTCRVILTPARIRSIEQPGTSPTVVSGRRRAVRLLAAIVTTFAACHLPLHGWRLWLHWSESHKDPSHPLAIFTSFTFLAAYTNSAVNPLLYCLLSRNFRVSIGHLVQRCAALTHHLPDVHPRRHRQRRCSPGEASDTSPQTTLTYRGDSVRVKCPTIVKEDEILPTTSMLTDGSGRDLARSP